MVVELVIRIGRTRSRVPPSTASASGSPEGIASVAGQLPVRERLLARFLQRDQGEPAEPELGSAAADRKALGTAPTTRGPHVEI